MTPDTLAVAASLAALALHAGAMHRRGRRAPERVARLAHGRLRERWVMALAEARGSEILAVQTLRNALMSSTLLATAAALALMGVLGLAMPVLVRESGAFEVAASIRGALLLALMLVLFASFVASTLAMRLLVHAGYMLAAPVGSALRAEVLPTAARYVRRAGDHYGRSLRAMLLIAPLAAGLVAPVLMPAGTAALIVALAAFERVPDADGD